MGSVQMNNNHIAEIVDRIGMEDIFNKYGFVPNRSGFICCPFHAEKTASLKAYQNQKRFKCFGCDLNGSVIDFVMLLNDITLSQAITKINYDFSLNLPIGKRLTLREQQAMRKANKERENRLRAERERKDALECQHWLALDEWIRLDNNRRIYAPKHAEDAWHPLYVEALQKIDYYAYLVEIADIRRAAG